MNQNKRKWKSKNTSYIPGEYGFRDKEDAGIPTKDKPSNTSTLLGKTAFRDLKYAQPITVMANPTAEATKAAVPYAIINSTNQVWEAQYPGESNLAGNTIPLMRNSNSSKLLDLFDCCKVDIVLKYLYAAIDPTDINQALNVQLGKSMSEALSKAYSEMYIQMPLFLSTITSSMQNCDHENRTQAFIWYQTMLQNIASIPAKYNMCISLEQHLKDSCYNRDVAPLDDLFGLLRKNSFRAKINAFSNIITGEYFDLSWFKQMNTLTMVPSRRTNSMRDPLLIIDACHDIPDIKIVNNGITALDSNDYKVKIPTESGTAWDGQTLSFQDAILALIKTMSPYNILKWARQLTNGIVSTTPTQYFNSIVTLVEQIRSVLNDFPADVGDIRTVLDIANRAGLNRWKRGIYFDVTKEMFYQPVFNKLCNDVFVNYLSSPNSVHYDNTTLRWKFYTLWDEYLGIPSYDKYNGGAFLTFSTRQFDKEVKPSTDTKYLVPKLFDIPSSGYNTVATVNRLGVTAEIGYTVYNSTDINNSTIYNRLNVLNLADYDQRVPSVDIKEGYSSIPETGSALEYVLNRLFSLGDIKVSATQTNSTINAEVVSAIDVELDDVSNSMIAFAQAYAPFKVYTPVTERTVGFKEIPTL